MRHSLANLTALGLAFLPAVLATALLQAPHVSTAHASASTGPADLYDLNGRRVGTLSGSPPAIGLGTTVFHEARVVSFEAGPVELPAGIYFVGPVQPAAPRFPAPEPSAFGFVDVTGAFLPNQSWNPSDFQAGDVNGDGRKDLVFSLYRDACESTPVRPFRVWIQRPDRTFVDETLARVPHFVRMGHRLELLDIDRDGDLDALLSGYACTQHHVSAALFINDGTGHFSNQTAARLPQFGDDRFVYLMAPGFLNEDVFPDLAVTILGSAVADSTNLGATAPEVWLNDGAGRLVRAVGNIPQPPFGYQGVSAADFTGDGREDIAWANFNQIITNQSGQPVDTLSGQTALFRNLGGGLFADETASRMPAGFERSQAWLPVADVDGDGDQDLMEVGFPFEGNFPQLRLLLNDGTGRFAVGVDSGLDVIGGWFNRPRFGRLTDWLGADLFLPAVDPGNGGNAPDMLLVNNGAGTFADFSIVLPAVSDFSIGCALYDSDGDGDLDIATANAGPGVPEVGQNRLYRNGIVPVSVDQGPAPGVTGLGPAFPNPARNAMAVRLSLAREGPVRVSIFDTSGRLVRELMSRRLGAGECSISWDLRDAAGLKVGAGLYSFRLEAEGMSLARRFVVTR